MSSFGSQMRKRLNELRRAGADVPAICNEVAEIATIEAVRVATEKTPQGVDSGLSGVNTRSGGMKQAWETDSIVTATNGHTALANNTQHASYVNDGHRMDKHFVPGLTVEGGVLQQSPGGEGGIMVGTKTSYVKGIYAKEAGIGKYRSVVKKELSSRVEARFKGAK